MWQESNKKDVHVSF